MQLDEEDRARRKLESRTQAKLEKMRKVVDLDTPGAAVRARTMLYAEMNLQAPPGSAVRSPRATSPPLIPRGSAGQSAQHEKIFIDGFAAR